MTPEQLLTEACKQIESKAIIQWATTGRNREVWLQAAETAIARNPQEQLEKLALRFSLLILTEAIGL